MIKLLPFLNFVLGRTPAKNIDYKGGFDKLKTLTTQINAFKFQNVSQIPI